MGTSTIPRRRRNNLKYKILAKKLKGFHALLLDRAKEKTFNAVVFKKIRQKIMYIAIKIPFMASARLK